MYYKIFIILIACSGVQFCNGQSNHYSKPVDKTIYITKYDSNPPPLNFRSFGLKDGLPRGEVTSFVQTDDGFVWFSMTKLGLVRFDGYHFRIFKSIEGDTNSLPNDHIFQIIKSHKNGLWLSCVNAIMWFDLTTYQAKFIPLPAESRPQMFYHLFEDSKLRLWVYWGSILYLYDAAENKFTLIKHPVAKNAFTGNNVNIDLAGFFDIDEFKNGDLFLFGNYLLKLNTQSFEFTLYNKINNQILYNSFAIDEDEKYIWLSGWRGLLRYDYKNDGIIHYNFEKPGKEGNVENRALVSEKNNNQLWLSNEREIRVFDKSSGRVMLYNKNSNENVSVTAFNAKGINGSEWFWNYKTGFTCILPEVNRFNYHKVLPENERVISLYPDMKNNTMWFVTEDRSKLTHLYNHYRSIDKFTEVKMPVKEVSAPRFIIPLLNNTYLIAICNTEPFSRRGSAYGKLFLLNASTNTITHISKSISNHNQLTTDDLRYRNAYNDSAGNLYITTEGDGVIRYDIKTQQFFQYVSHPKDSNTLSSNYLYSAACGSNNTIWIGNNDEQDNILNKLDVLTGKVQRIPLFSKDFTVQPLCEDKKGNVWISTHSGLVCYNRYSGEKYVAPKFTNLFTRGFEDSNGNIILQAPDGFWFYDPLKRTARRFDEQDGIRLEYYEDDFLHKRIYLFNDSIFISDSYRFPVSDLYPKKEVPPLHFTSIKIFDKEITTTKNVDVLDTLILPYNENQLSIEFAALSFLSPERNIYACMLEGSDKDWIQLGSRNSIIYANLAPGNYTFKIKTANLDGVWGKERKLFIEIIPAFWQTTWFKILIAVLIAAFFYWLYSNRLYKINLRNRLKTEYLETQKKEAEFNTKLSEVELSALRSQMNPHFIFNCLNSIKLYTVENDSFAASEYLTKFSRLIRLVLENSRKDKVELQSELESLRLYIEMEAMRFKEKLNYVITENIDTSYTEIPPLLIQPYVENAIWHGLMHKESGGNLHIVVDKGDADDLIKIIITDDGIGRTKAAELKSKSAVKQKSFGMRVTSERIALINQLFKTNTTVQIIDLVHKNGEAAGTQVIIQIPV